MAKMKELNNVLLTKTLIDKAESVERITADKYVIDLYGKKVTYERFLSGFSCHYNIMVDGINWFYNIGLDDEFVEAFNWVQELYHAHGYVNEEKERGDVMQWVKRLEGKDNGK